MLLAIVIMAFVNLALIELFIWGAVECFRDRMPLLGTFFALWSLVCIGTLLYYGFTLTA